MLFNRFFRFSLDGLLVGQIVLIALLWVSKARKYGAACIPVPIFTAFFKRESSVTFTDLQLSRGLIVLGTRIFTAYSATLDVREADIVCKKKSRRRAPLRAGTDPLEEEIIIPLAPSIISGLKPFAKLTWRIKLHPEHDELFGNLSATQHTEDYFKIVPKWKFWKKEVIRKALRNSGLTFTENAPILSKVSSASSTSAPSSESHTKEGPPTPPAKDKEVDPFTANLR